MDKKNTKKINGIVDIDKEKTDNSPIDAKTEMVNGLGASAEFTSVD